MDPRRRIPRTDRVLADPRLVEAAGRLGRDAVKKAVVHAQQRARNGELAPERVAAAALAALGSRDTRPRTVVNATGVIVHTNLGRAPLPAAAADALIAATGCTDVEFDLATGRRARRGRAALRALAEAVPDAEAVHVVNNNAAALMLAATVLAQGKEIVISRGELVEIGDGFRIPELLAATGARLREVGATNRTALNDYRDAIGPDTGFVLKVHPSNFRIEGFTAEVTVKALAELDVPVIVDIGSGLLRPEPSLPDEPDAASALRAGASVVTASGDKLLGGPQAGLLLGREDLIERLRRHPVARALRVDKLTLAALEATLRCPVTPTAAALHADPVVLADRARRITAELTAHGIDAAMATTVAAVGGGGAPGVALQSAAVTLPERYAVALRGGEPAVVGRMEAGRLLLDLRAVPAEQDTVLIEAVLNAALGEAGPCR